MATVLGTGSSARWPGGVFWRWTLALAVILVLLVPVALSGGFRLAEPVPAISAADAPAGPRQPLDGRGKWTGYTR